MKNTRQLFSIIFIFTHLSCAKNDPSQPVTPVQPVIEAPVIPIVVDVNEVVRTLSGDEVGINMNYLMDDAVVLGNAYEKTAQGLKQMGAKILRYPGGEKSDNYYFASPPYASAAPKTAFCTFPTPDRRFFNADQTAKSEVLDFDEMMLICNQTGSKPLIVVAYDAMYSPWVCGPKPTKEQLLTNAKEWVRYANITKKYGIKLWMIGNESFLKESYNGFTTPAQYALDVVEFADAMRSIDPSIKIVVNGKPDWWPALLNSPAASKIDFLGISNYLQSNISSYDKYRTNTGSLNAETDLAIAAISRATSDADKSRIGVIETEFNSIDFVNKTWLNNNNLGHALCNFEMLSEAILKPKLYTACLWNTRWIENATKPQELFDALQANGQLNATGLGLGILGNNLLKTMVKTTASGNIKCYASYDSATKRLHIFVLNKETSTQKVKISAANFLSSFKFNKWELKGTSPEDRAPTWDKVLDNQAGTAATDFTLPAHSITMLICEQK